MKIGNGAARHRTTALALTGALLVAVVTSGAAKAPTTTLRAMMSSSGVDTLNPFLAFFNGALDIFGSIYPSLNSLDADGRPGPYLATSWTPSADRLTWTFKLRDGLKWSDGVPLTAADAAWTLNLVRTDPVAGTANGSLVSNVTAVTARDATTLVIETKKPQANIAYISVPINGIPIVPQHIWQRHVADLKNYRNDTFPIVGYGPWTLTAYRPEQYAKFVANKSFVLGRPKFDRLVEQSFKASDAAIAALRSGQLDYAAGVQPTQFKAMQGRRNLQTFKELGNGWTSLEINTGARTRTGRPIGTGARALADPSVRRAMSLAFDRQALVTKVLDGMGQVGWGYLPPAWPQWRWAPAVGQERRYDPAAANRLLDGAGYPRGPDGIRTDPKTRRPLAFRLGIHSDDYNNAAVSTYLAGWLKQIGIKATIQALSMTTLNSDLAKGDWDLLMDSWTTGPDPTYLLGLQSCATLPKDDGTGGSTDAFFCDQSYDALFDRQLTSFDSPSRTHVIGQMLDILYKADVDQILYYADTLDAARKDTVSDGLVTGRPDATGHYPAQTSFWSYLKATPGTPASGGGGGAAAGLGAVAVAAVLAGGGVALRRRLTADDRE